MIIKAGALAGLALFAASSVALPVTFDFGSAGSGSIIDPNGQGNDNRYYRVTVGEQTLAVTGYREAELDSLGNDVNDQFSDREEVTRDVFGPHQGLGVDSDGYGDSDQMDGSGTDEALRFAFSGPGTLTNIVFNHWDSNDDFDLAVDGIGAMDNVRPAYGNWSGAIAFTSWFAIGADHDNDNFRVRSITVDFAAPSTGSVPEPGSLALVGVGLLSLFTRRRS